MNVLDLAILLFISVGCFYGYRKGLFRTIVGFFGYIVAMVFSMVYYKQFGRYLDRTFGISEKLFPPLKAGIDLPNNFDTLQIKDLPVQQIATKIDNLSMPATYKQEMHNFLQQLGNQSNPNVNSLGDGIISLLVTFIINGASIIIICFIIERLFAVAGSFLATKKGFAITEKFDKLIGAGIGGLTNILMILLILVILRPILTFGEAGAAPTSTLLTITDMVNQSTISHWLMSIVQGIDFKY